MNFLEKHVPEYARLKKKLAEEGRCLPFLLSHAFCTVVEVEDIRFSDDPTSKHPERFLKLRVDDVLVRTNVKRILDDLEKGYEYDLEPPKEFINPNMQARGMPVDKRDPEVLKKAKQER